VSAPLRILSHLPLGLLKKVAADFPDAVLIQIPEQGEPPEEARGEILLTQAWGSPNMAAVMARGIAWVHCFGTGVNDFPFEALRPETKLSCSRGASGLAIAEWTLAMMLAAEKDLPNQWLHGPERWKIQFLGGLHGKTVGILGFGAIGQQIARLCLAFGMHVRGLRRTDAPSPVEGVEIVTNLGALLGDADHVVVAAPATAATRHIIGSDSLKLVKPGVHVVNVARGALVDQEALREALDDGRVGLASLDVVEPEPPPQGHWLYSHPRVRLSAHISWSAPWAMDGLIDPFVRNLHHWVRGEPLDDEVDLEQGY
jgi:phosphoglycerate dehydrogenase-like enzyme